MNLFSRYLFLLAAGMFGLTSLSAKDELSNLQERPSKAATVDATPYTQYFGKPLFLDLSSVYKNLSNGTISGLSTPPVAGSEEEMNDEEERTLVCNGASDKEIVRAVREEDNIFSFSTVLGTHFNADELPKTAFFFQKIYDDSHRATTMAKMYFKRPRPLHNSGYAFPSAHSTRAFLWESLLEKIISNPKTKQALEEKAWEKAWDRVILGRHYPKDVEAGRFYGEHLAKAFLKNPEFVSEWNEVAEEIKEKINTTNRGVL